MNLKNSKPIQFAAAGLLALAVVQSAEAVATLRISTNGTDWSTFGVGSTVTDTDGDGFLASVFFNSTWTVSVALGDTKPLDGSATSPEMHLSVFAVSNGGGGTLYIQFSDDFFGPSSGSFASTFSANLDTNPANSISYSTSLDTGNSLFGGSALNGAQSGGPGGSASLNYSDAVDIAGQYSLTQTVVLTHGSGSQTSSADLSLRLPEGGFTLSLLGGAMLGVALLRKRLS